MKRKIKRFEPPVSVWPLWFLLICILIIQFNEKSVETNTTGEFDGISSRDMYVELPDITRETMVELIEVTRVESSYQPVLVTYKTMELISLGEYFITAYCPAECGGSWATASGATCHRASYGWRLSEPTTCAISRSVHGFGETFYIPAFDRTFVSEDTGPGVNGRHLDLFYEEYSDVCSFPTGYYEVYSVQWVEHTEVMTEEEYNALIKYDGGLTEYFHMKGDKE